MANKIPSSIRVNGGMLMRTCMFDRVEHMLSTM